MNLGWPGLIPDEWGMPKNEAVMFYGSPILAEVLEGMPHTPVVKAMREWLTDRDLSVTSTWGLPDFLSARDMCNMTREQMAEALNISVERIEMIEMGILVPTVSSLFLMAMCLDWPIGAFFRGVDGWHHRTGLGRKCGYPINPLESEHDYPGWLQEIAEQFDRLDAHDDDGCPF